MSILAAADPEGSLLGVILAVLAGAVAVAVAALTGLLRPPRVPPEPRVPPDRPLIPLGGVLFFAVATWIAVPSLYFQFARGGDVASKAPAVPTPPTSVPPTTAPGMYGLSPREVIAINAGVPVLAFVVLLVGDAVIRLIVGQRLGFNLARLPRGVLAGGVGILLALPLVYCVMVLTALAFRLVGYEPPGEHELLKTMGETPDAFVKYLAIAVAVVIAPLWEELLFRGHVQTLIREGLIRLREPKRALAPEGGFPVFGVSRGVPRSSDDFEQDRVSPLDCDAPPQLVARAAGERKFGPDAWIAIGVTSLLFAGVHQPWQTPPIFCLSVCLGLAYERTGNLWAPVVMHALFNGLMTAFFLGRGTIPI